MDLDAIKRRRDAATPGPWVAVSQVEADRLVTHWAEKQGETITEVHQQDRLDTPSGCVVGCWYDYSQTIGGIMTQNEEEDAIFIAHSWQDVGDLIAEVERLQREYLNCAEENHALQNQVNTLEGWRG